MPGGSLTSLVSQMEAFIKHSTRGNSILIHTRGMGWVGHHHHLCVGWVGSGTLVDKTRALLVLYLLRRGQGRHHQSNPHTTHHTALTFTCLPACLSGGCHRSENIPKQQLSALSDALTAAGASTAALDYLQNLAVSQPSHQIDKKQPPSRPPSLHPSIQPYVCLSTPPPPPGSPSRACKWRSRRCQARRPAPASEAPQPRRPSRRSADWPPRSLITEGGCSKVRAMTSK